MIKYLKSLADKFIYAQIWKKALTVALALLYLVALLSVIIKLDVVITTPGSFNTTAYTKGSETQAGVIKIDTENEPGKIYTIGVYSHIRVTLFQYLISRLSGDINVDDYDPGSDLSKKEEAIRGDIHREFAMQHALILAYTEAAKVDPTIHIAYEFKGLIVSAVLPGSKSNLEQRDLITHINDEEITSLDQFWTRIALIPGNTAFTLTVLRPNGTEYVEKRISAQKTPYNDAYVFDVEVYDYYVLDPDNTTPKYEIATSFPSRGSSGGAMTALAIYNALLSEDVTGGLRICGTGTINVQGVVGKIGGVEQKIVTAKLYGAEVFFVGVDDYEDAKKKYDEIKADFHLISVESFAQILTELERLRGESDE